MEQQNMVKINSCSVTQCAYNKHNSCHTLAITVGGPGDPCPNCDTFMQGSQKGGIMDVQGGIGACKVERCMYNQALECNAPAVDVGMHESHPDCFTYKPK